MVIFRDPMLTVYSATRSGVTCVYVNVTQENVLGIPNGVWVLLEYIQAQAMPDLPDQEQAQPQIWGRVGRAPTSCVSAWHRRPIAYHLQRGHHHGSGAGGAGERPL